MPRLIGTSADDALTAPDGRMWLLRGLGGDDYLTGNAAADTLLGGAGYDWLYGGLGDDFLRGGGLTDNLYGEGGNDRLNGDGGDDQLNGGDGDDVLIGSLGNDGLFGDAGNDSLYGGAGADWIDGGEGWNFAEGGDGDDTILINNGVGAGQIGNDTVMSNLAGGARVVQHSGLGSDIHIVRVALDGLLGIADIAPSTEDRIHAYAGALGPSQVFAAMNTNGDTVLDGRDGASALGTVASDATTVWLWIGDDVIACHGISSIADWQMT